LEVIYSKTEDGIFIAPVFSPSSSAIPKILAGAHAGSTSLISVTFREPFTTAPSVIATASGSDAIVNNKNVVIRSITTTGFEAKVTKADDGTDTSVGINWVAIGS
jgi:hypothetical protein